MNVSGRYERHDDTDSPFTDETIRLDVDGAFPQMAASGTSTAGLTVRAHWVAQPLTKTTTPTGDEWRGPIRHKFGNVNQLPYDTVVLRPMAGELTVTFQRTGLPDRVRSFALQSPHFHEVTLEYDAEEGVDLVLDYQTHGHPDRPAGLPNELLSIDTVYERAGFRVVRTGQDSTIPLAGANANEAWSDNEMHDAMQTHFSVLAALPPAQRNRARWALWTFFAGIHEEGNSLGGIMFDSIGAAERQGTALFMKSFIANVPDGDPAPAAWRQRMAFWTAVHEMGHAFNLLHAWDKAFNPWLPQAANFDLLTFMNYPFLYQTGSFDDANTINFFRDFRFRFTDNELLFLRHAPENFVIMGGERFGDNHAFAQARLSPAPALKLEVRVNREKPVFDFMEPVVVEFKLTNVSRQPMLVPEKILKMHELLTVQVQKRYGEAKTFHPFAHACYQSNTHVLEPGESLYEALYVSVGHEEWLIDEPGYYTIQACVSLPTYDILSNELVVRVTPPRQYEAEYIAQDYFSEDVGRVLTFDGSQVLTDANDILREVVAQLPESNASIHARISLELPNVAPYKLLDTKGATRSARYGIREAEASKGDTQALTKLLTDPKQADHIAAVLGHIDYRYYAERVGHLLKLQERDDTAKDVCQTMHDTLKERGAAPHVLEEISAAIADNPEPAKKARRKRK